MRYLAIDLGDKRTGLAVGDDITQLVSPVGAIEEPRGIRFDEALDRAIELHNPGALVIGMPYNMDGSEGPRAKLVREFGEQLAARTGLPVHYQDERLTSERANQQMARTGRTHKQKKKLRDALAAAAILRDFLESES